MTTAVQAPKKNKVPQKPDLSSHKKNLSAIDEAINELKSKQNDVSKIIDGLKSGKNSKDPRSVIRQRLAELRDQQSSLKGDRQGKLEELSQLQASMKKKTTSLKALQSKIPFKTLVDLEDHILKLERQVESGKLKIIEEKRVLSEISQLKRNKKNFDAIHALEDEIDEERQKLDKIRALLDEGKNNSINSEYDELKQQLEKLNLSSNDEWNKKSKHFEKKDELKKLIDEQYNLRREAISKFNDANDEFYNWRREDQKRRQAQAEERKKQEEKEKLAELIAEERALAELPAFENEISQCNLLLNYFAKLTNTQVAASKEGSDISAAVSSVPSARQIDSSNAPQGTALSKKNGREESYFMGSKPKKAPKKTKPASNKGAFTIPLAIMESLVNVKIQIPSSASDIPNAIISIQNKIQFYRDNQIKASEEKKAKAELRIKALQSKFGCEADDPQESASVLEPTPELQAAS